MTEHYHERFTYRRELTGRELLPAVGVAIGVGALAFYVVRVMLERTPLGERPGAERPLRPRRPAAAQRPDGAA